jgi:hypothetical protein
MTEAAVSFAGNLTDDPEVRYTDSGIARAILRVAVNGRRDQEASFFTVVVWRDQAEHAVEVSDEGQPRGGRGPAPAAGMDHRGWQRPLRGRVAGRGAGSEPAVGNDDEQGDAQLRPVTRSTYGAVLACRPPAASVPPTKPSIFGNGIQ